MTEIAYDETAKTTITEDDYLRPVGLFTLIRDQYEMRQRLMASAAALLGYAPCSNPNEYRGYLDDAVYGSNDWSADNLLQRLKIVKV